MTEENTEVFSTCSVRAQIRGETGRTGGKVQHERGEREHLWKEQRQQEQTSSISETDEIKR